MSSFLSFIIENSVGIGVAAVLVAVLYLIFRDVSLEDWRNGGDK